MREPNATAGPKATRRKDGAELFWFTSAVLFAGAILLLLLSGCAWSDNLGPKQRPTDPFGVKPSTNAFLPPLPPRVVRTLVQRDQSAPAANVMRTVRLSWDRQTAFEWYDVFAAAKLNGKWQLIANQPQNFIDLQAAQAQKFFAVKSQNEFGDSQ